MKTLFKTFFFTLAMILILTLTACEEDPMNGKVLKDKEFVNELYAVASDTIFIDDQELFLYTELWKNMSPGGPIDTKDRRLMAVIHLVNADSTEITRNMEVTRLYVIHFNNLWKTAPEFNMDSNYVFRSEYISKSGPDWPTNIYVDVVVEVVNTKTKKKQYLIARDQYITEIT